MGLTVHVYRWSLGDCTNHGISAKATELCIVNVEGPTNPHGDVPVALLIPGAYPNYPIVVPAVPADQVLEHPLHSAFGIGKPSQVIIARPSTKFGPGFVEVSGEWKPEPRWTMAGGNIASSSDSRWCRAVEQIVGVAHCPHGVAIHDRIESREEQELYSR